MVPTLVQDVAPYRIPLLVAGGVVAALLLAVLARWLLRRLPDGTPWWYYLASLGGLCVSLNTSWRFFGDRLHIVGAERIVMFSVVELALVACALGMRANVRRIDPATGRSVPAGAPRLVAWALCGLSAYAALLLSGPVDGAARVALGPVLCLVMLHMALGIEIRHAGARTGTWTRVMSEIRERALSRLGLADDDRNAATRTRERAAGRAARLAMSRRAFRRATRLTRALRAAGVAHDEAMRERLLAELAVLRHANELGTLPQESPWAMTQPVAAVVDVDVDQPQAVAEATDATVVLEPVALVGMDEVVEEPTERLVLDPPASDDTMAGGQLDGVLLAAHADDTGRPWAQERSKNAAVDRADAILPGRSARALVAALSTVGVLVAESSVRRRRAARAAEEHQPVAAGGPRPESSIR
jgi:hypothetical protein